MMNNLNGFIQAAIIVEFIVVCFAAIACVVSIVRKDLHWLQGVGVVQLMIICAFIFMYLAAPFFEWVSQLKLV